MWDNDQVVWVMCMDSSRGVIVGPERRGSLSGDSHGREGGASNGWSPLISWRRPGFPFVIPWKRENKPGSSKERASFTCCRRE